MNKIIRNLPLALLCGGYLLLTSSGHAQGTAFTYQGRLNDGGNPATGNYDLTFAVFDAASDGNQMGTALTVAPTGVTNGLFTVTLDFGSGIFPGAARWLEIGVRTNGKQRRLRVVKSAPARDGCALRHHRRRKPRLIGSGALPHAEFRFRDLMFQVDDGGDTGGDGLWITPKDGLPHPVELWEIREHVERLVLQI